MFRTWFRQLVTRKSRSVKRVRCSADRRKSSFRPNIESLEDRLVMTSQVAINAIVADYALNTYLGQPVDNYHDTADGVGSWRDYQGGSIYWSPYSGAHEIGGAIYAKWQSNGGVNFGYPTTDETSTPDGLGRYNHFAKQQPWGLDTWYAIDWIRATGQAYFVNGLIGQKFFSLGAENFGEAITDPTQTPDKIGVYNHFQKQQPWGLDTWYAIDWTPATGAHFVNGLIGQKFFSLGAENFGEAITDPTATPDGVGSYNHFEKQQPWGLDTWYAIDWTPATGAHEVHGLIGQKFFSMGAENFGEAITDETTTPDGIGRYNHFEKQQPWGLDTWYAIDWTPATGAHEVHGLIGQKFFSLGAENFGEAITDGLPAPSMALLPQESGEYNHFEKMQPWGLDTWYAIDWTTEYGAHEVHGLIGQKFFNMGAENSGVAITDEIDLPNGAYNHFLYATVADVTPGVVGTPANVGTSGVTGTPGAGGLEVGNFAIDWTPAYGAHAVQTGVHYYDDTNGNTVAVQDGIYLYFAANGGEQGPYGLAISDQYNPSGLMSATLAQNFTGGVIESQWVNAVTSYSLGVSQVNATSVVFSWSVERLTLFTPNPPQGYYVHFGPVSGPAGPQVTDSNGGFTGSIIVGESNPFSFITLTPGVTYLFGIDPYYDSSTDWGWGDPIYFTMT
jgi:hypothetical protein